MSPLSHSLDGMCICDEIDAELRLLAAVQQSIREWGGVPSNQYDDESLLNKIGTGSCG